MLTSLTCTQRTDVLRIVGSGGESHATTSITFQSETSTISEGGSVTLIDLSMESDFWDQQEEAAFLEGYHNVYSLDSDPEADEDGFEEQPKSPEPPEISYLSLPELESSVHGDSYLQPTVTPHTEQQPAVIPHAVIQEAPMWTGFCIYGDNVDKEIRPRHQTVSEQTKSMHMFQSFAQLDRINLAGVSDEPVQSTVIDPSHLKPSAADMHTVLSRIAVMISRLAECNLQFMYIIVCEITHSIGTIHTGFL